MENNNVIYGINGPVVTVKNTDSFEMMEMVHVGKQKLVGEIIGITDDITTIQVYEETTGLKPGDPVEGTGAPMNVLLGPGIIDNIFDGIERPLKAIEEEAGAFINRGSSVSALDDKKLWNVTMKVKVGDKLEGGQIYATLPETPIIEHRLMVPPELSGEVVKVNPNGDYKLFDTVVVIKDDEGVEHNLTLCQQWPIRTSRPVKERLTSSVPLITGQRVIDALFPIAKGGVAAIPGPFGSGKTVTQHQLAKWAEADIVVYIGCGERGNEMTDVLNEFPELIDPHTGKSLMERTVLIANTSDMPVAAREASIYTGITIAEYYRDMGYSVALMADSTSRWAEALREMSGRLEEMPGEEGYPAYLGSRLAQFYERAGRIVTLGSDDKEGSLSVIGAVSPPGGDISEPVSQATLRIVKVFWGLDSALAYKRHFPAINWLTSYSLYADSLGKWFNENVDKDWTNMRTRIMGILSDEASLDEIVKLVGMDALSPSDRLKMEAARSIREDFLHQLAFHEIDTYTSLKKQCFMMKLMLMYYDRSLDALNKGADIEKIAALPVREAIGRFKYVKEEDIDKEFAEIDERLSSELAEAEKEGEDD